MDKCTCAKCGAKSLYIQFFQFNGKYYCRMCYTECLQQTDKKRPILLSPGCPERAFFFEEGVFRDNFEVVWGSSAMAFCRTKKLQK